MSKSDHSVKAWAKSNDRVMRLIFKTRLGKTLLRSATPSSIKQTLDANYYRRSSYVFLHWANSVNFGDQLSLILTEALSNKTAISPRLLANLARNPVYSCIGSVLQYPQSDTLEVWGSGFINGSSRFIFKPKTVHAVRGPLTRRRILDQGINCPDVYGDPATIAFDTYSNHRRSNDFKVGLVPHYADVANAEVQRFARREDVLLIDVLSDWREIAKSFLRCDTIVSSSLHGLILADALGIPNRWLGLSELVMKDRFKFLDYFASVQRVEDFLPATSLNMKEVIKTAHLNRTPFSRSKLIDVCPFVVDGFQDRLGELNASFNLTQAVG